MSLGMTSVSVSVSNVTPCFSSDDLSACAGETMHRDRHTQCGVIRALDMCSDCLLRDVVQVI